MALQRRYFEEAREEIARMNLNMLRVVSSVGALLVIVFILVAPYIVDGWRVTIEYQLIIPTMLGFAAFSFLYGRSRAPKSHTVSAACALFYVCLMALFIALSVFPYPDDPETFISLCFMFIPVLFILPMRAVSSIILLGEAVFVLLGLRFKTERCMQFDLFRTMVSCVFSHVVMAITMNLRTHDYFARMSYMRISMTDSLTGLLNRGAYEKRCREYFDHRGDRDDCMLAIIDVDNFKTVNDQFGHQKGDSLLSGVAGALSDMFSPRDVVGRIGGDEFCVLMRSSADPHDAKRILERVRAALRKLLPEDSPIKLSVSVGVAHSGDRGDSYEALFRLADDALYEAKRLGKDRCVIKSVTSEDARKLSQ